MNRNLSFNLLTCFILYFGMLCFVPVKAQDLGNNLSLTGPSPGADGSSKASGTSYGNVIDGNVSSIWGATATSNESIAVKWSSPVTANTVIIREVGNNITSWRLETNNGTSLATGTTVGAEKMIRFESTTDDKFRFVILSARANPKLSEFEVYNASIPDCSLVTLQAEDGTFSSGSVDTNHSGYTGSGFVNTNNAVGEWVQFSVKAAKSGKSTMQLYYANGGTDDRPVKVSVNGSTVMSSLSMPSTGGWAIWKDAALTVSLNAGINVIRFTALNSGGVVNVDKLDACVPGGGSSNPTPTTYKLISTVSGEGSVSPAYGTFTEGASVTLKATPAAGWEFKGWSGNASGSNNPLTITMNSDKNITATFAKLSTPPVSNNQPIGYASLAGGTTGGAGGTSVIVRTGTELQAAIKNKGDQPLTIYVDGTITKSNSSGLSKIDVKEVSDISILGLGAGAEFIGIGIKVYRASNIIIRNLKIHHVDIGDKDCISIEGPADHVWVDHCELYNEYQGVGKDYYDGLLDAKGESEYITFSWNYLHDSWKASLSGSSDSDNFERKITYHHNYFENINSRLPLFRFGKGHVFNNYYKDIESSAINSRMGACVKIENNYFENVQNPYVSAYSKQNGYGDISGNQLVNSAFDYSSEVRELQSCTSNIPYSYSSVLHQASEVPAIVKANAGVGKINIRANTVANTGTSAAQLEVLQNSNEQIKFYPNPYQGSSTFEINLSASGKVKISLYDMNGNQLAVVANEELEAGKHRIPYKNSAIKPGMYFFLIETDEGSSRVKVLVQ